MDLEIKRTYILCSPNLHASLQWQDNNVSVSMPLKVVVDDDDDDDECEC